MNLAELIDRFDETVAAVHKRIRQAGQDPDAVLDIRRAQFILGARTVRQEPPLYYRADLRARPSEARRRVAVPRPVACSAPRRPDHPGGGPPAPACRGARGASEAGARAVAHAPPALGGRAQAPARRRRGEGGRVARPGDDEAVLPATGPGDDAPRRGVLPKRISLRKRLSFSFDALAGSSSLTATRPPPSSVASYTLPAPPSPIRLTDR
jgi:hypothetical protein